MASLCPLCGTRKARRACPALGRQICSVCCGTKRLVEIRCPSDCGYLTSSREHPPAVVMRQQQRDFVALLPTMSGLDERQSQLLFALASVVAQARPEDLVRPIDDDVADAAAAVAATLETSARGVIYEHQPTSPGARRLVEDLKALLARVMPNRTASLERDAAIALRRIEQGAREVRKTLPGERSYIELLGRLMRQAPPDEEPGSEEPRLIVP